MRIFSLGNLLLIETSPTNLADVSDKELLWHIVYMCRKGTGFPSEFLHGEHRGKVSSYYLPWPCFV